MKIKLSTLKSVLRHSKDFDKENQFFLQNIEQQLKQKIEVTNLEDYDCDLKLIFIETGGSEGLFLKNMERLQEPYFLLTSGGNNSLAASLEIVSYLQTIGKQGEIIHGDTVYIAQRIKEIAIINQVRATLKNTKLGVIGSPSDWLISSVPNYDLVQEKLGLKLQDISLTILEEEARKQHASKLLLDYNEFDVNEVNKATYIYEALCVIIKRYQLQGLTLRCFDLLTSLKMTGCLGLACLNQEGIVGTCEGDIMAMISMYIGKLITGQSSFQANPSRIDITKNEIVFAHCTVPMDMVESYTLDTHFESGIGVAIRGKLKTDKITIFRMSSDLKNYFVGTGSIIENLEESNLCRTQIKVAADFDTKIFLNQPCGNHHIIFYGDYQDIFCKVMKDLLK